jgi:hypothetical protein
LNAAPLALAVCLLSYKTATSAEVSLAGNFGTPRVIVPAPAEESIRHLSWPKVVRANDGVLIVAYIAGRFHGTHGGGCPAVSISTDNGKSFSSPQILKRYQPGDAYTSAGNLALGLAEDGAAILLSMAYNGDTASTIDGWRSEDSGRTWQPIDVSTLDRNQTGSVFGHVVQVPSKGLAVFGHYRPPATEKASGIWMAWSSDRGKTWGRPQPLGNESQHTVEPAFTFADGRFIGLVRGQHDSGSYIQMTSDDHGRTWHTKPKGLISDATGKVDMPAPHIAINPDRPKHLYALASERHRGAPQDLLGRIVLYEAEADELDWKKVGEVARFPKELGARRDFSYAWMTPLDSHRWYVVFYCGQSRGPCDIYGLEAEFKKAE